MDNARIKENIIRKRTEKGISQDEMAQRLEMSRNSYRNIEKGSTYVVSRHLKEIADILNITEEELVLGYKPAEGAGSLEEVRSHYSKISDDLRQKTMKSVSPDSLISSNYRNSWSPTCVNSLTQKMK